MSVQAIAWVLEHSEATGTDRLVLLAIANHADADGGNSWAAVARLARLAKVSERAVQRALSSLRNAGEIRATGKAPTKRADRAPTCYELPRFAAWKAAADGVTVASPRGSDGATPAVERGDASDASPATPEPSLETVLEPSQPSATEIGLGFADFWELWPEERRQGKGAARDAFRRAVRGEGKMHAEPTLIAAILDGARRFAADPNLPSGPEAKYIPNPSTWLNQERWEDGPLPERGRDGTVHDIVAHLRRKKGA